MTVVRSPERPCAVRVVVTGVFLVWPGRSRVPMLARYQRIEGVTLIRLTDFVRCHLLWQVRFRSLMSLFGS